MKSKLPRKSSQPIKKGDSRKKSSRLEVVGRELKRIGKVGGIRDCRLGVRDYKKSDEEKILQRQIVERLRQLESIPYDHAEKDDPLIKAAFSSNQKQFQVDAEVDGGISSNIVDEEFFANGVRSGEEEVKVHNFRDALAEKIAATKLERLKRVEENEEQREKLKTVDKEWTGNIRFLLSKLPNLKTKKETANVNEKALSVAKLLDVLSSDKKIIPIGSNVVPPTSRESQLNKLRDLLDSDKSETDGDNRMVNENESGKSLACLIRILLEIPNQQLTTITFLSNQLLQAKFRGLKDVIHYLFLTQLTVDYCQMKNEQAAHEQTLDTSVIGNGSFCPEVIQVLTSMLRLTLADDPLNVKHKNLLYVRKSMTAVDTSLYSTIDLKLSDPSVRIPHKQMNLIRLACINRILNLINQVWNLYNKQFPSCVITKLFGPIMKLLESVDLNYYPISLQDQIKSLIESIKSIQFAPTPNYLVMDTRLTVLSVQDSASTKVLKKFGLLPQLEPSFQEKTSVRQPKKENLKQILKRQVSKEKRGAMRDIRRDGQALAIHQLKFIKESDAFREKKTQAILRSIRSVED